LSSVDALKDKEYFDKPAAVVLCTLGIAGTSEEKRELGKYILDSVTCPVYSGYPYGHVKKLCAIDYGRSGPTALGSCVRRLV